MDKSLLLPRELYLEECKKRGKPPYTFEIINDKQSLFYFGANHSRDPLNHQYPVLREYWNKFLNTAKGKDCIVLIESGLRKRSSNEEEAIETGSEGSLVTLFAQKANIPVVSPDLSGEELLKLLPNNEAAEVFLYRFLVLVNSWQKYAEPRPNFENLANHWLTFEKEMAVWEKLDISLDKLKLLYKEVIGKDFNENDNVNNLIDPNKTGTRINQIARSQSDIRDFHIASEIERYWNGGKSMFVAFGCGHLIIEEPALKQILK